MRTLIVFAVFILSGAAGLVYEIVWSRQLVLVFGNTTQAVSAILTGFFGGMAIGAAIGGRVADRVRSPLRMYGLLELVLVVVVLVTPLTFGLIHEAYRGVYPSLEGTPWLGVARLVLAVLALAPATILMGATFPALVGHFSRATALSVAFGRLYSANTFGAVLGTLLAGFLLIELLGLAGALAVGAGCSAVAGLTALWLSRADADVGPATRERPSGAIAAGSMRLPLIIAFISGLTSLGYQVTWTRLLASGTGGLTYVFTVILALFLVGIAAGAIIFSVARGRIRSPIRVLAASQLAVAVLAMLGLLLVITQPKPLDPGDPVASVVRLVIAGLLVVLPVTTILGIAFPTASALLVDEAGHAGAESGGLLAANTVGAIVGSLVIPFVLMPTVGSPWIIVILALTNATLGVALAIRARPHGRRLAPIGVIVIVAILAASALPRAIVQPNEALLLAEDARVFASDEDEIASVQAGQQGTTPELWVQGTSMTLLTVDARLMPILPLIARPEFRAAARGGLRDGQCLPDRAGRRPAHRRRGARAVGAGDVPVLLPGCARRPRRSARAGDRYRRAQPPRADRRAVRHHRHRPAPADRELGCVRDLVVRVLPGRPRPISTRAA